MNWNVEVNDPPLAGTGHTVYVDGEEMRGVVALDVDEGWVERHRKDESGKHILTGDGTAVATEVVRGVVSIFGPDGRLKWMTREVAPG